VWGNDDILCKTNVMFCVSEMIRLNVCLKLRAVESTTAAAEKLKIEQQAVDGELSGIVDAIIDQQMTSII
jgi:hypothetical protein